MASSHTDEGRRIHGDVFFHCAGLCVGQASKGPAANYSDPDSSSSPLQGSQTLPTALEAFAFALPAHCKA
jgi:hypothetical protein